MPTHPTLDFEPPGFVLWDAADLDRRNAALATRVRPDRSARETLADYGNPSGAHRFRFIHRSGETASPRSTTTSSTWFSSRAARGRCTWG